jgi:hypothetical protein
MACSTNRFFNTSSMKIGQGIAGKVIWLEGNLMPKIQEENDTTPSLNQGKPVERYVCIYELTHRNQTVQEDGFYKEVNTRLVKKIMSDQEGNFATPLDTGQYSLFVEEHQGLFSNRYDGEGYIYPVSVKKDRITQVTLKIDYKAAY